MNNRHTYRDTVGRRFHRFDGRMVVLAWTFALGLAGPAVADCRFKLTTESGRQVAVAAATPLYANGQLRFRISRAAPGAALEVRFKPGGKFKPRFSPTEVIQQLNEVDAGVELIESALHAILPRLKGWDVSAGACSATFAVPETLFAQIRTRFLDFGLGMPQATSDINPSGAVDTSGCAA